jgi:hypothetical protein
MSTPNPRRTTFSFAPPVDNAAAWDLNLDNLANRLLQAFPGASATPEGPLGPRASEGLSFELPLGGGVWLEGLANMPYPGMGSVMAVMATADEAAVLARWLRDSVAPAPDLVYFTSELALDRGDTDYQQIPPQADREEIARVLQDHLDHADRS